MGQDGFYFYFPSEERGAEDFFALKNPTASAGFEPANLGTKSQHATSRPPKTLKSIFSFIEEMSHEETERTNMAV
jgi:hypothetical protein